MWGCIQNKGRGGQSLEWDLPQLETLTLFVVKAMQARAMILDSLWNSVFMSILVEFGWQGII